jgi:hypothetical protein
VAGRHADRVRLLQVLLGVAILSTAVHYTDNYVAINDFPQPGYVAEWNIIASWIVLTAVGLLGYRLYTQERFFPAHACLAIYSYTGLSSLGHYLYGGMDPVMRNVSVVLDGLTGASILAFAIWSAATVRPRGGTVASA